MFNDDFSSVGAKIKQKIPYQTGNFKDYLNRRDAKGKLFINSSNNSLFLSPTVPMEVVKIIDGLDMKNATGPNSIPNIILKSFKLFWLINLCFEVDVFPDILKTAKITLLHKKDSKIYEKVIYIRIYSYLTKNNLIYSKQFDILKAIWLQKQLLNKLCADKHHWKHSISTWPRTICLWHFLWLRKSLWHCWPWNSLRKTEPLWCTWQCK